MRPEDCVYELKMSDGTVAVVSFAALRAIHRVVEVFPGAHATHWRVPGKRWVTIRAGR